jgi:hypothetical protein
MRFFRILSLIFFFGAAFFGAVQIFNNMRGIPDKLSLQAIWQHATSNSGDGLRDIMPTAFLQDMVTAVLTAPCWLASLLAGVAFWALARATDED